MGPLKVELRMLLFDVKWLAFRRSATRRPNGVHNIETGNTGDRPRSFSPGLSLTITEEWKIDINMDLTELAKVSEGMIVECSAGIHPLLP